MVRSEREIASAEGTAMFRDGGGPIGLGQYCAELGDEIFVLKGGSVLCVLRPEGVEGSEEGRDSEMQRFRFVGECYVYRLMGGEAVEMLEKKQKGFRDVILV